MIYVFSFLASNFVIRGIDMWDIDMTEDDVLYAQHVFSRWFGTRHDKHSKKHFFGTTKMKEHDDEKDAERRIWNGEKVKELDEWESY